MSGASSLASARRRRAAPQQNEPMNVQNKIVEQSGEQKIAPLELLQLHDKKIASLQENIEATVTNIGPPKVNETTSAKGSSLKPKNKAIIIAAISSSSLFVRKLDKKYNRIGIKNGNKKIRKKFEENLSTSIDVNKIKARIS